MTDYAKSKCRITEKMCSAWSEAAGCGLVCCKFVEKKVGGEILKGEMVTDDHHMTNADRINAMTIEEKADFLSSIAYCRETPWSEPFARSLCDSCPTVHGTYESGIEDDFHECDFVDGKCPHGSAIVWWLQQPAEDSANG